MALIHLEMQTYVGDAKLAATVRRGKQPLSKRFQSLQIDACYRYKREVAPVAFSALMGIPSLTKVTVRCHFTSIDLNYVNLDSDLKGFKTWLSKTVFRMKVISSKFVTSEGRGDSSYWEADLVNIGELPEMNPKTAFNFASFFKNWT